MVFVCQISLFGVPRPLKITSLLQVRVAGSHHRASSPHGPSVAEQTWVTKRSQTKPSHRGGSRGRFCACSPSLVVPGPRLGAPSLVQTRWSWRQDCAQQPWFVRQSCLIPGGLSQKGVSQFATESRNLHQSIPITQHLPWRSDRRADGCM